MKVDVQDIINKLPRSSRRFPNAIVWQDAAGQVNVEIVGGGALVISEAEEGDSVAEDSSLYRLTVGEDD